MAHKQSSALVYLNEELGDARLLCEKLKKYVDRAIQLIEKSGKRDHFFEVAGDIIEGLPKTTQDLHKALQAVALATNRLDYEEVKQTLPAEKVEELEEVLEEIRLHPVRRQSMKPEDAVKQLQALAAATKRAGEVPVDAALDLIAALEDGSKTASAEATADNFTRLAEALTNPPEGVQGVSRRRLAALVRQALALSLDRSTLTASRVAARAASFSSKEEDQSDKEARGALEISDLKKLQKTLEDILVEAKKSKSKDIENLAQKALQNVKVASDDEEREARFEEGKPADPTKNMSPEDAKKWKENVDHDGSNIKSAAEMAWKSKGKGNFEAKLKTDAGTLTVMALKDFDSDRYRLVTQKGDGPVHRYSKTFKNINDLKEQAQDIVEDDDRSKWTKLARGALEISDLKKLQKTLEDIIIEAKKSKSKDIEDLAQKALKNVKVASDKTAAGKGVDHIESKMKGWKSGDSEYLSDMARGYRGHFKELMSAAEALAKKGDIKFDGATITKTASDDDKEARFEEGKPADPTKNMSPEDAKKWKENVDHDGSNIKSAAALEPMNPGSVYEGVEKVKSAALKMSAAGDNWKKVLFHSLGALDGVYTVARAFDLPDIGYMMRAYKAIARASGAGVSTNFASTEEDDGSNIKSAAEKEKESKFEEGKPADPTKNMSPADAKEWKQNTEEHKDQFKAADWKAGSSPLAKAAASDFSKIKPGSKVTLADSRGKQQTGTAKSKSPAGWVIDMGGKTSIATPDNTVKVK